MKALFLACTGALALSACTSAQLAQWTSAATATAAVIKQIGSDIVAFDCANADLIYVIAQDANAGARVKATLAKNAQIAKDACPLINNSAAIVVQTGAVVSPASAP
jgi:maleate cis-trans isomerase